MLWRNEKIKTISWGDFFQVVPNEYKVFKIVPHLNVSNQQNRHLWYTLHKAYELYHNMHSRTAISFRSGIKIRQKDYIWLDVVFRVVGNEKKVEFYASTTETMAKKFRNILENKLNITIEESDIKELEIPKENTIVHDLKYLHHDIFSLNTNHNLQTTPIAGLLNSLDEMDQDGDFARISICNGRESRQKWVKNASWALEKAKKGKVPQRANMSPRKVGKASKRLVGGVINEVGAVMVDVFQAIQNIVFNDKDSMSKEKLITRNDMIDELHSTKPGQSTIDKINAPVWKNHTRVAVHSSNKFNRDNISSSITSSYSEISDKNELISKKYSFDGIKIKVGKKEIRIKSRKHEIIEELNTLQLSQKTKNDPDTNIVSSDEMGKLFQLPTAELQRKYEDSIKNNKRVNSDIPSIFFHKRNEEHVNLNGIKVSVGSNNIKALNKKVKVKAAKENGILIGHSELKGENVPISIPSKNPNEFYKGYVFLGGMGAGKDTAIQNFVREGSVNHNLSFVVIDQVNKEGLEGMANGIRDTLPSEKIIDIDLSDERYLPPMDLTEIMAKIGRKGADRFANELIDFFGDMESMGQSRKILRDFAKASNGSLYNIKKLLEEESFRKETAKRLRQEGNNRLAEEIEKYLSEFELVEKKNTKGVVTSSDWKCTKDGQKALDGKASAILNRLDEFFGDSTLFEIFAQPPKEEMNFEKWMKEGKVIIFRVPDRILSTVAVRTLVHWITLKVLMTRLLMTTEDQENGTFMIFNEPQTYLSGNDGLAELLKRIAVQGRKERIGSIFACHHFGQIKEIETDLISGGCHFLLFQNDNQDTFKKLEAQLKPIEIETALNIPNTSTSRHAICIFNFGGERKPAFMVELLKPSYIRNKPYDNSFLTQRHSRMYGRSYEEIEELLAM
jgi:hypothetical protein